MARQNREPFTAKGYAIINFHVCGAAVEQGLLRAQVTLLGVTGHLSIGPCGVAIEGGLQQTLGDFPVVDRTVIIGSLVDAAAEALKDEGADE